MTKRSEGGVLMESFRSIEQSTLTLCSNHLTGIQWYPPLYQLGFPTGKTLSFSWKTLLKKWYCYTGKGGFPSHSWGFQFQANQTHHSGSKQLGLDRRVFVHVRECVCVCLRVCWQTLRHHMEMSQSNHKQLSSPALRASGKGKFT